MRIIHPPTEISYKQGPLSPTVLFVFAVSVVVFVLKITL